MSILGGSGASIKYSGPLPYSNNISVPIPMNLRSVALAPGPPAFANNQEARLIITHRTAFLWHGDTAEIGSARGTIESQLHYIKSRAKILAQT